MPDSVSKCADQLAAKEHHDRVAEALNKDTRDTEHASGQDQLAATDLVCDETGTEGRHKDANRRGSIEDLLIPCCNLKDAAGGSDAKSPKKRRDGDDVAH